MTTLRGVNSCTNWPATAQTVRIPSFSVMLDAFPMNWMSGTPDISVIRVLMISYHACSYVSTSQSILMILLQFTFKIHMKDQDTNLQTL